MAAERTAERKSRELLEQKAERLKGEAAKLKEMLKKAKKVVQPKKLSDVFGEDTLLSNLQRNNEDKTIAPSVDCASVNKRILNFFSYLDQRDYIRDYQITMGTYDYFKNIMAKLAEHHPIAGEEHVPDNILKNAYHFYRTITKNDIILIKDIIEKERDVVEQTMDYFYKQEIYCEENQKFIPSFGTLYEYAHFFLSTMSGKTYLFRLGSKTRILLLYYSTMIIHKANDMEINKYGLDIRPLLKKLEDDLKNYKKLYYSDKYIGEIENLKKHYSIPSPVGS